MLRINGATSSPFAYALSKTAKSTWSLIAQELAATRRLIHPHTNIVASRCTTTAPPDLLGIQGTGGVRQKCSSLARTPLLFHKEPSARIPFHIISTKRHLSADTMAGKGGSVIPSGAPAPSSPKAELGFKQLFDDESSTFTYLIWDEKSKDGILVDPVDIQVDRDLKAAAELGVNLVFGINTHAHADHITGTYLLKQKVSGLKSIISEASGAAADIKISAGDKIVFGSRCIEARATPGHTAGCLSYVMDDETLVLTGDALLIHGCGRTDFQGGSADTLYASVHSQIFTLPDGCIVYPAHDYKGRTSSTVGDEKANNPRLGATKTKEEFIEIMNNLNLSYPKKIDVAVPANMKCGVPDI